METIRLSIRVPEQDAAALRELHHLTTSFQKRVGELGFAVDVDDQTSGGSLARGDWHLMARLEHLPGNRLSIALRPGSHLSYDQIRSTYSEPNCVTCNVRRKRRITFLLASGDDVIQVGSSCLRFVLTPDEERQIRATADELGRHDTSAPAAPASSGAPTEVSLQDWLAQVAAVVRVEGKFVKTSEDEQSSTAAISRSALKGAASGLEPIPFDRARAGSLIRFVRDRIGSAPTHSRFDRALIAAYSSDIVEDSRMNLAASAWLRHFGQAGSEILGEKDEPFEREVFLIKVSKPFDRGGKTWRSLLFEDPDGHWLQWFTTTPAPRADRTYALSGIVDGHRSFGGRRSTIVTRCIARPVAGELTAAV